VALTTASALAQARLRATWNRIRRDSGAGGAAAVAALGLVVALVLLLPALTMVGLGREIGLTWEGGATSAAADRWLALQAVFALIFPVLGASRYRPVLEPAELGSLPVTKSELLLAELPAQLAEIFPLLGATGVLFTHLGLALGAPSLTPWAVLGAIQGTVWLLGATIACGAIWRALRQVRWPLALATATLLFALAGGGGRAALRAAAAAAVAALPGSWLIEAARSFGTGRAAYGLGLLVAAAAATGLLLAIAGRLRLDLRAPETPRPARLLKRLALAPASSPIRAVAGVFLAQLLDARAGRALVWLPALLTVPFAVVARAVELDAGELAFLPERLASQVRFGRALPLYTILPVAAVLLDGLIWLNPFGWYRKGIRALLALPVARRDLAAGTLLGVALVVALQCAFGLLPLLAVRPPSPLELSSGLAGAAAALLFAGGVGQAIGLQFPRAVGREAGGQIPFHLAWIPPLVVVSTGGLVTLSHRLASLVSVDLPAFALGVLALLLFAGYRAVLPLLERELEAKRERLLSM
jgi:hypothetical protein